MFPIGSNSASRLSHLRVMAPGVLLMVCLLTYCTISPAAAQAEEQFSPAEEKGFPNRGLAQQDGDWKSLMEKEGEDSLADSESHVVISADKAAGSALGLMVATGPGFFLHGLGHLSAREPQTAFFLAKSQLVSMGLWGLGMGLPALIGEGPQSDTAAHLLRSAGIASFVAGYSLDVVGMLAGPGGFLTRTIRENTLQMNMDYVLEVSKKAQNRHLALFRTQVQVGPIIALAGAFSDLGADLLAVEPARKGFGFGVGAVLWRNRERRESLALEVFGQHENHKGGEDKFMVWVGTADLKVDLGRLHRPFAFVSLDTKAGIISESVTHHLGDSSQALYGLLESGLVFSLMASTELDIKYRSANSELRSTGHLFRSPFSLGLRIWVDKIMDIRLCTAFGSGHVDIWLGMDAAFW